LLNLLPFPTPNTHPKPLHPTFKLSDELFDVLDGDALHWRAEGDAWEPALTATLGEIVQGWV
jgi:hypothetical protein